jgi:precorrin-6B methylase 2
MYMRTNNLLFRFLIVSLLSMIYVSLFPQVKTGNINSGPSEGQAGKNVPWITTPQDLVVKMLKLANVTPKDFLIDLGSGDGRLVITAAKAGTRGLGIEYNPDLVKLSKKNAEKEGVSGLVQFIQGDIFESDFSKATVITMFLLPEINLKLRPKLLSLKPGTRIVTNTFTMQEWQYDEVATTGDEKNRWNTAYLWIVPSKVDGKWQITSGGEIVFIQEFQMLTGSATVNTRKHTVSEGRLRGNEITFRLGGDIYKGIVSGNKIEGTYSSENIIKKWSATR